MEQALALLRFQLEDLLAEVKWVLEDFSEAEEGRRCACWQRRGCWSMLFSEVVRIRDSRCRERSLQIAVE